MKLKIITHLKIIYIHAALKIFTYSIGKLKSSGTESLIFYGNSLRYISFKMLITI